jgi:peptidoglycan hydrolase CwlO-like protein
MKKTIAAIVATIVGIIGVIALLFKKSTQTLSPKLNELDKKAEKLKEEVKEIDDKIGKPVEDKSLESELDYWKKK